MINDLMNSSNSSKNIRRVFIKHNDFICKGDIKGEIILPISHYVLINSDSNLNLNPPKIIIYGLGSCIALILYDLQNKTFAMSHILLPHSDQIKDNIQISLPHEYAGCSVSDLVEDMIIQGAESQNIKAVMIGGSRIFQNQVNSVGAENIKVIKCELERLRIRIIREDFGGKRGRNIIYDTKDNSVYVKTTGEEDFRKLL